MFQKYCSNSCRSKLVNKYIWIEGQDVDCESGASGSDIQLSLQFIATGNSKQN